MTPSEKESLATSVPKEVYLRVEHVGWFGRFFKPRYLNLTQMLYTMNNEDIGAFERQTVAGLNLEVDTTADESDGDYTAGDLSLREAIGLANGNAGADTITFSTLFLAPQKIALDSQLPTITDNLTITGPGQTLLTLDAGNGRRTWEGQTTYNKQ